MIRFRGTVAYKDGREETFEVGTATLVAWEAYCRRQSIAEPYAPANGATFNHFVAHLVSGSAEGFDLWLKGVDGVLVEPIGPEAVAAGEVDGAVVPFREGVSLER